MTVTGAHAPGSGGPRCSVIVPAHDEAAVIGERLGQLVADLAPCEAEIIVVANGCTDDTAAVARKLPGVQVLELDEPSKIAALNAGDAAASAFPRIYLDADVRLRAPALRALVAALDTDRSLAGSARVTFDVRASSWAVRAFHAVFARLPYTRKGLIGLGLYGLSRSGRERFGEFPDVVADDLFVQSLFRPEERLVVDETFEVVAPGNVAGLLAVRKRVARGNRELAAQASELGLEVSGGAGTARALAGLVAGRPRLLPAAVVYLVVTVIARCLAGAAQPGTSWERDESSRRPEEETDTPRIMVDGLPADVVTEDDVVRRVMKQLEEGHGGRIITSNVDIHRQLRMPEYADLADGAELVVADGMPLVWASRLEGHPLPARVTGASLVWSLAYGAGAHGRSVFILGAQPEVAALAADRLRATIPELTVAGVHSPPFGFESSVEEGRKIVAALTAARPDVVFVALGFPKQERLMAELAPQFPGAWFIGCGGSIDFVAGRTLRAPRLVQRIGLEWVFRLAQEPRRLFRRYVIDDLPHAVAMLSRSAVSGLRHRKGGR